MAIKLGGIVEKLNPNNPSNFLNINSWASIAETGAPVGYIGFPEIYLPSHHLALAPIY